MTHMAQQDQQLKVEQLDAVSLYNGKNVFVAPNYIRQACVLWAVTVGCMASLKFQSDKLRRTTSDDTLSKLSTEVVLQVTDNIHM